MIGISEVKNLCEKLEGALNSYEVFQLRKDEGETVEDLRPICKRNLQLRQGWKTFIRHIVLTMEETISSPLDTSGDVSPFDLWEFLGEIESFLRILEK